MKWEYMVTRKASLTLLGEQGWELVAAVATPDPSDVEIMRVTLYLKRPLQNHDRSYRYPKND